MFFPINTDAPLYHRPIGTVGLIAANLVTFALTSGGDAHDGWLLTFGNGLHPTEWLGSAFLHFGPVHLIGNMIFLWAYGLIIEGKIGTWRFLGVYLGLCLADGLLAQSAMLFTEPSVFGPRGAGGASGVIFALMVIALLWAPRNNFDVVWLYNFGMLARAGTVEFSVLGLSGFYIATNLLTAWLQGWTMGTAVLHLLGAIPGLPVGLWFLHKNWVDCEGWDLLSLWKKEHGLSNRQRPLNVVFSGPDLNPGPRKVSSRKLLRKTEEMIDGNCPAGAFRTYQELRSRGEIDLELDLSRLRKLIEGLRKSGQSHEAALLIEQEFLPRHPPDHARARLLLASLCVTHLGRPKAALRTLESLSTVELSPAETRSHTKITAVAQRQIGEGTIELSTS